MGVILCYGVCTCVQGTGQSMLVSGEGGYFIGGVILNGGHTMLWGVYLRTRDHDRDIHDRVC